MSRLENIQNSFKSIQAKTKAFFHGDRWKEVLVFFFFALLAFGFWLLQSLQQEYEIELVFPVKYKNVPADIAFNAPEVETITAKVKDKGSVLLNYTFGRSFAPIEVNMKNTKEKNGSVQVSKRQIENDIQNRRNGEEQDRGLAVTDGTENRRKAVVQHRGENAAEYDNDIIVGILINIVRRFHPVQDRSCADHGENGQKYADQCT